MTIDDDLLRAPGGAPAPPAELPAELDNAIVHNRHKSPGHVGPVAACPDTLEPSERSLVVRMLPDGPRRTDGSLAFTAGLCVYLPPRYLLDQRRYPVVYLLHGGGGDASDAVTHGRVQQTMDGLIADDPGRAAIVVMPDGTNGQWYDRRDGSLRNEEYMLRHVLPYVDDRFRTIADRSGRAVVGASNGGFGAMVLAAKAPDRFAAAGGMSSNLHAESMVGLGWRRHPYAQGNKPVNLVGNLRPVAVTMDIATSCPSRAPGDRRDALRVDRFFLAANRSFARAMRRVRGPVDPPFEYRETVGSHCWRWWAEWLRDRQLPFVLDQLAALRRDAAGIGSWPGAVPDGPVSAPAVPATAPTGAPAAFDYRSMATAFSVWGHDVAVTRADMGFTTLREVGPSGLTVEGAGTVRITAAPRHQPGEQVLVTVTGSRHQDTVTATMAADEHGRLTVTVALGSGGWRRLAFRTDRSDGCEGRAR